MGYYYGATNVITGGGVYAAAWVFEALDFVSAIATKAVAV